MHALQQLLIEGVHLGQAVLLHRLRPRCLAQACGTGRVCQQARQRLRQGWRIAFTDRKFNRMRPSMARVFGLETRSVKAG